MGPGQWVRANAPPPMSSAPVSAMWVSAEPAVATRGSTREAAYAFAKRTVDLLLGSMLLVIAIPIILMAAVAIRVETPVAFLCPAGSEKTEGRFVSGSCAACLPTPGCASPVMYDYSSKPIGVLFHHEEDLASHARFLHSQNQHYELPNLWNVVLAICPSSDRAGDPKFWPLRALPDEYLSIKPA